MGEAIARESVSFRPIEGLAGVQIMDACDTDRRWQVFNVGYAMALSTSWAGDAAYRGRRHAVSPGMVFCTEPGETHTTPRVRHVGTFHVLFVEAEPFSRYLSEQGIRSSAPRWRHVAERISEPLLRRFVEVFRASPYDASMKKQSNVVELIETMVPELVDATRASSIRSMETRCAASRIRERLHGNDGMTIDLEALAADVGMSRFQVLRAFKKRYGLPPHRYQLCQRIWAGQALLMDGRGIADVAAGCGFVDQSHFGRHFKRILGITPGQVSRARATGTKIPPILARSDRD